ncbi:MAG: hypothetical protein U0T77_10810 [Chitinophagales bacterium]
MKQLGAFTQDGFKGSIELLRFQREINENLISAISSIVGSSTVFISGGVITEASGNTTITDGVIMKDQKLYSFTGGTYSGSPSAISVIFTETTASGYPQPYFVNDPIPKDIYLERAAAVGTPGVGDVALLLTAIGSIRDLEYIKSKVDLVDNKADKNGFDVLAGFSLSAGFSYVSGYSGNGRIYHDGTVIFDAWVEWTGNKAANTSIVTGLPAVKGYNRLETVILGGSSTSVSHVKLFTDGTIKTFTPFSTPDDNCIISIIYKKQ